MYTISHKYVYCPVAGKEICLSGKYHFSDNEQNIANFVRSTCPIIENSKLPHSKQSNEFLDMHCLKPCNCLKEFEEHIDTRNGYYQ